MIRSTIHFICLLIVLSFFLSKVYIFSGELWEVYELLHEMMYHGLLENGEYMVIWANQENFDYKQLHLFQGGRYGGDSR